MDTVAEKTIAQLQERIEHLEENRRFFHNSLEMVLNLADFRNTLGENIRWVVGNYYDKWYLFIQT